ncbi:MAG: flagellar hook-length control protein FliK [bacterium]|nr:flagellar hook-length control protein FliK [bacterium]
MNVDLMKALDARGAETPRSDPQAGEGEFPEVFESTLEAASSNGSAGNEDGERGESPSPEAAEASTAGVDAKQRDEAETASGDEDGSKAEAAAESGAVGGTSTDVAERVRVQADTERWTAEQLEGTGDESAAARAAVEEGLEEGEALDEAQAREVIEQLEAEGRVAADGDEASATAEAAVTGAVASGIPQAAGRIAEGPVVPSEDAGAVENARVEAEDEAAAAAFAAEERPADADQNAPREDAQRAPDESVFERAAEGSAQSGVDPNLRQAVANAEEAQRAPEVASVDGAAAVASPVAGQVTETTTTATPGSPQPAAASQAISVQTEWLATRGGGTARMVLHPPELGEIAIRVSLRGGAVDVVMVAQEAAARGVAEEQSERLAQAFANRDLRLENFEVRRGSADDLPNGDSGRFAESGAERDGRPDDPGGDRQRGPGSGADTGEAPMAVPRILSRAPETGVDLRI